MLMLTSFGFVTVDATSASAADCTVAHVNHNAGWDVVIQGKAIRSGPNGTCAKVGEGSDGRTSWDLHCWVFGSGGGVWWFGKGSDGNGWVNSNNLTYNNNVRDHSNLCSTAV
jgi:hypothetical protein